MPTDKSYRAASTAMAATLIMFVSPQPAIRARGFDATPAVASINGRATATETPTTMATAQSWASVAQARSEIEGFSDLQADWDSYGAEPIPKRAIDAAAGLLISIQRWAGFLPATFVAPYFVAPLASGGVQIEWRGVDRAIEVVVRSETEMDYLIEDLTSGDAISEFTHQSPHATVTAITSVLVPTAGV